MDSDNKQRVLFLCTGNSARSQMAEAILRELGGDVFEAYSAGLDVKSIHPLTFLVLEKIDINTNGLQAKPLKQYLGKVPFHFFITVCEKANSDCPINFPGMSIRYHWEFEDPAAFEGSN